MSIRWKVDSSLLNAHFAQDINDLLASDEATWVVTQGFRSGEEQQVLYDKWKAGGPLAAPPGRSAHEKGLAVDVTLVVDGKDVWAYDDPNWRRLVGKVKEHPRLHSLDNIGDTDHIEAVNWRQIAAQQIA